MNFKMLAALALGTALATPMAVTARDDDRRDDRRHAEYGTRLSGAQEVPPVDTETRGRFRMEFKRDMSAAEFRLRINDGMRVTQAHIHCGPEGSNGPAIIFLGGFHERGWDVDGWWVGNAVVTDDNIVNDACGTTLVDIAASMDAGMAYVNVHTVRVPSGEIRGQIKRRR